MGSLLLELSPERPSRQYIPEAKAAMWAEAREESVAVRRSGTRLMLIRDILFLCRSRLS